MYDKKGLLYVKDSKVFRKCPFSQSFTTSKAVATHLLEAFERVYTKSAITCSKLTTIKTLEEGVKYFQS